MKKITVYQVKDFIFTDKAEAKFIEEMLSRTTDNAYTFETFSTVGDKSYTNIYKRIGAYEAGDRMIKYFLLTVCDKKCTKKDYLLKCIYDRRENSFYVYKKASVGNMTRHFEWNDITQKKQNQTIKEIKEKPLPDMTKFNQLVETAIENMDMCKKEEWEIINNRKE